MSDIDDIYKNILNEVKKDTDLKECKECKQLKKRILDKTYKDGNRRYLGEDGLMWNGRMCGACHQGRVRTDKRGKKHDG
jgi:hypothetical protein